MAHTLTFYEMFHVLVNDVVVSSPYTLQNDDVITIQMNAASGAGYAFYATYSVPIVGNLTRQLDASNPLSFSVSDSDITLTAQNQGGAD